MISPTYVSGTTEPTVRVAYDRYQTDDPPATEPPRRISREVEGELNRLSPRQRRRFWSCYQHKNEWQALNVAKSSPR